MMTTPPSSLLPPTPRSGPVGAPQSTSESHVPPTPGSGPDGGRSANFRWPSRSMWRPLRLQRNRECTARRSRRARPSRT
eukprot:5823947-Pyramimonas_sp.AAC.1